MFTVPTEEIFLLPPAPTPGLPREGGYGIIERDAVARNQAVKWHARIRAGLALGGALLASLAGAGAGNLDTIGVTLLRQVDATLNGTNIPVVQAEASASRTNAPYDFEVNPASAGQFTNVFTYTSGLGTSTAFTNAMGLESGHADAVAACFYGTSAGVAPKVKHVYNYEANYFVNSVVAASVAVSGRIINQSFTTSSQSATLDQYYDNYAVAHSNLFFSGAGNGGAVNSPATCYNGLGVGAYGGSSSVGPTTDGRCKPDLTAPGEVTSFTTPYAAGAAAVLLQAANRGDGGSKTNLTGDIRTLKALLLNGAVKPAGWTNGPAAPLDARYGAGVLNVFNSWKQLAGGRQPYIEATTNAPGGAHFPGSNVTNEASLAGWDLNSLTNPAVSSKYVERVNHYYFNLNAATGAVLSANATLVWNRQSGKSAINDLNLFLYSAAGNLVACSTSLVDNVEHLAVASLPKGRYDLQVQKRTNGLVTTAETYALAFEFFNTSLSLARSNRNAVVSWPVYPAGFALQSSPALGSQASWTTVNATSSVSGGRNVLSLPATNAGSYFRLHRQP